MGYVALTVVAKFVMMLGFYVSAAYIARWLHPKIPDGRLKTILYRRLQ